MHPREDRHGGRNGFVPDDLDVIERLVGILVHTDLFMEALGGWIIFCEPDHPVASTLRVVAVDHHHDLFAKFVDRGLKLFYQDGGFHELPSKKKL
jgi:hypothetical protein